MQMDCGLGLKPTTFTSGGADFEVCGQYINPPFGGSPSANNDAVFNDMLAELRAMRKAVDKMEIAQRVDMQLQDKFRKDLLAAARR